MFLLIIWTKKKNILNRKYSIFLPKKKNVVFANCYISNDILYVKIISVNADTILMIYIFLIIVYIF